MPVCPDCGKIVAARGMQNHREYIRHDKRVSSVCQQERLIVKLTSENKIPAGDVAKRIRSLGLFSQLERGPVRTRARMTNTWWAPAPLVNAARHCPDDAKIRAAQNDPEELMRLAAVGALGGASAAR